MQSIDKFCGTCRWWSVGFCSSVEVMQHLALACGTWRNYVERGPLEMPLLEQYRGCYDLAENPVKDQPGPRPKHTATSSTTEPTKPGAYETIDRSVRGE